MDVPTFIVGIANAVAWPGAMLLLALLFRREIRPLIRSLRRFSWGDKVVEFDKRLEAAEDQAKALPEPSAKQKALPPPDEDVAERFEQILDVSPELAIVQAWLPVERELLTLAAKRGYNAGRARSASYSLRRLVSDGVIDKQSAALIDELRKLRALAAHPSGSHPLTVQEARRYAELAQTVIEVLQRVPT